MVFLKTFLFVIWWTGLFVTAMLRTKFVDVDKTQGNHIRKTQSRPLLYGKKTKRYRLLSKARPERSNKTEAEGAKTTRSKHHYCGSVYRYVQLRNGKIVGRCIHSLPLDQSKVIILVRHPSLVFGFVLAVLHLPTRRPKPCLPEEMKKEGKAKGLFSSPSGKMKIQRLTHTNARHN